jgi:Tol biopolymer transport system component
MNLSSTLTIDQDINLQLLCYCWLHDIAEGDTTGLIYRNGTEKLGYQAWMQISSASLWQQQPNKQIVFMSRAESTEGELYLLDKQGSITRLTNNDRLENNPALSFDGTQVAYHAGDEDNPLTWEIYILNLTTREDKQLTDNNVLDGHPDWSPDGTKIIYASFQDEEGNPAGAADLYVINPDGTPIAQLTENQWEDNDPEWSPDGTKIAFKSTRRTQQDAREEIYIMDSNGENVTQLTTTSGWGSDHDPSWSPDSSTIAFMRYEGTRPWTDLVDIQVFIQHWDELTPWNTYTVDLQGTLNQVTNTDYIAQLAVFSSDGKKILFLDNEFIIDDETLRGIYHRFTIINPDGTSKQQLVADDQHIPTLEYFDW